MKRVNIKYLVCSLILILSLTLGAGCHLLPDIDLLPPPNPPSSHTATPIDPDWTLPPIESDALVLPNITDVVAKVKPSVVAINTIIYDIFNRPEEHAGSGWIIDEDGIIITNNHVVEGAESVTVTLANGETFPAEAVCVDSLTDLAVVKINAQNLPPANIGDSCELRVGDWVVAIGNSLGLGISATKGIVSCLGVSLPVSSGQTLYDLIQTDAAINPGNSGGPLVNMRGEVVGITSVKIAMVGVEGMGWAISGKVAMPIIEELVQNGYVIRPWLGVAVSTVNQYLKRKYDLAIDEGAFLREVIADSPADEAGLEEGDAIVSLQDREITTAGELVQALHSYQIGQRIKITYWRGSTKNTTYAILIESPPP
ncbi:MAG TPA: PDZ domain-containing protein [Dehalococcoidia bacterium]|nr:PDZ domain-containing protein [Dehalococcoidia bacterium]